MWHLHQDFTFNFLFFAITYQLIAKKTLSYSSEKKLQSVKRILLLLSKYWVYLRSTLITLEIGVFRYCVVHMYRENQLFLIYCLYFRYNCNRFDEDEAKKARDSQEVLLSQCLELN